MNTFRSDSLCAAPALGDATRAFESEPVQLTTVDAVNQLNVFDFDGTLFRSPEPNADKWTRASIATIKNGPKAKGLGWYQDVRPHTFFMSSISFVADLFDPRPFCPFFFVGFRCGLSF
ncbi:hypothetical protein TW95_gp0690 [Pandoravirus inopinatum]|uniref:Uncharacterized protein n=1 Tax=Pandoravirus inopinatum TaxID=1605721 RepID=A0A0B5J1M8_9VIRU|nr:hypothetical protein TW95_gp0690 [Pandoravirus inopinatum]AJF97424.1 hypothetical protein [Pandoravirus inopinatum]